MHEKTQTATAQNITQQLRRAMTRSGRVTMIVSMPFWESYHAVLGFLNNGKKNVTALKSIPGVFAEFFFDGHPKAVMLEENILRAALRQQNIELPADGILDPQNMPSLDRESLKTAILTLPGTIPGFDSDAIVGFEKNKFRTLGDAKKQDIGALGAVYQNMHIFDLRVRNRNNPTDVRTINTFKNSPVISSDHWEVIGVGEQTVNTWTEVLKNSEQIIILGNLPSEFKTIVPQLENILLIEPALIPLISQPIMWETAARNENSTPAANMVSHSNRVPVGKNLSRSSAALEQAI
ncbi:MAG: hypothetical protein NC924_02930 [Candidatus Omnitrophica bacterium]|nr:hypothetical protein [Candidatus Omnitrophota bacterium]